MVAQNSTHFTPFVVELEFTALVIGLAFCVPSIASRFFAKLESSLGRLARRRALSVAVCGVTALALRLLILPVSPVPHAWIQDDFSYLLAADTFAHGRLANPTPAMWMHFESFHIDFKPTYMSMYFPAQGMVMAAGQVIAGNPWWGVWVSCGLMCAAICWMLQGWLPAGWALLGGMIAVIRLALFSYWIDTYTGGAVAATGGALVLGALPRLRHGFRTRDFIWMALGIAILANSRPYEGLLVSAPAVTAVVWWCFRSHRRAASVLVRRIAPGALILVATFAFIGYYNYRVFGNAFTPPYKINRETYASAPHFVFQTPRPEPVYRHRAMRNFYTGWELKTFREETASTAAFFKSSIPKLGRAWSFFLSFALFPPMVMLPGAVRDRRIRLLSVIALVVVVGLAIETWFFPHYLAPATALIYAILLQCMRHLRARGASGLFLVRALPVLCVLLAGFRVGAGPLHIELPSALYETGSWYGGAASNGNERAQVLARLESLPGPQLAIVRYFPDHLYPEWVYNLADIDKQKVIWAREMDPASNLELLKYYRDRTAWLVEPDYNPPKVSRFLLPQETVHPAHD